MSELDAKPPTTGETRVNLSVTKIRALTPPPFKMNGDSQQVFLRDTVVTPLAVRCTSSGAKSFIYEGKLDGKSIRLTLGKCEDWPIDAVRAHAREISVQIDKGIDPRAARRARLQEEQSKVQQLQAQEASEALKEVRVEQAWCDYMEANKSHWGERHLKDHLDLAQKPGVLKEKQPKNPKSEADRYKKEGPLHALMGLKLAEVETNTLDLVMSANIEARKTRTRLAYTLFRTFMRWCAEEHDQYKNIAPITAPKVSKTVKKQFGKTQAKRDSLRKVQLESWFHSVLNIPNPITSACLQVMLLTGARVGEVLAIRWQDIDFKLKEIVINDKVEDSRTIPLTPYVEALISQLPRLNEYVFASGRSKSEDPKNVRRRARRNPASNESTSYGASETGHISPPRRPHYDACRRVGIKNLTLHGLRRSFKSLTEWVALPVGVTAQIMGHKPSAIAEKHYVVREPEILLIFHTKIERWLLKTANVNFDCPAYAKYQPLIEIDAEGLTNEQAVRASPAE